MVRLEVTGDVEGFVGTIAEVAGELTRASGRTVGYDDAYGFLTFLRRVGAVRRVGYRDGGRGRRAQLWQLPATFSFRSGA